MEIIFIHTGYLFFLEILSDFLKIRFNKTITHTHTQMHNNVLKAISCIRDNVICKSSYKNKIIRYLYSHGLYLKIKKKKS